MLTQGNKYLILVFFILLILTTCKNENKKLDEDRKTFYNISVNMADKKAYEQIYDLAFDTISSYVSNNLTNYRAIRYNNWQLDSLMCFNKPVNKCIGTIIIRGIKDNVTNSLRYIYGVKIKNRWYFFDGGTIYLFSEKYHLPENSPLSFEKMKQLAMKYIYYGYLTKNNEGQWIINDNFFSSMANKNKTTTGYGSCFECKTEEEYYLYLVGKNWEKK